MRVKIFGIMILSAILLFHACSASSTDVLGGILFDQAGTLSWGASPAVDGSGMTFNTGDETYGVPGTREDYADYFSGDENQVQIVADIKLTGKTTVRGWGAEFPEIKFIEIKRVEQSNSLD